ncbi:MAG: 6-phosphofructokinase, partial [Planctomycetota bacterium]
MSANCLKPQELPDLKIEALGPCKVDSPLIALGTHFAADNERIAVYSHSADLKTCEAAGLSQPTFERAGPRRQIFFDPKKVNCGVVTCGGLCPGLNDVVRTVTLGLTVQYGVENVFGFRYGYLGLTSNAPAEPMRLTPQIVDDIHLKGGDILSSSRGPQDLDDMVDTLERMRISVLFTIGGDGTLRGAGELVKTIKNRKLEICVIGIPKTIDNDISGIEQSFGFSTAVEASRLAVCGAHEEARGAWNGVGLVKLMGRDSG